MAITLNAWDRQKFAGTWQTSEQMTQSTATAPQALALYTDVSIVGVGTATGAAVRNKYTLADGVEGQRKVVYCVATGEASVIFTQPSGRINFDASVVLSGGAATAVDAAWASATGQYVLQAADEYVLLQFMNAAWHVLAARGATLATVT